MPEMKGLSQEQIDKLLKPKGTKPKKVRTEPLIKDPLMHKQIGPIKFVNDRGYCISGGVGTLTGERYECRCPTYTQFQGLYYCNAHALQLANQMLVAKGVLS